MTTKKQAEERQAAIGKLREILPPGSTVYTIVQHVSRSGMSRSITCLVPSTDYYTGKPAVENVDWLVARALGRSIDQSNGGVTISGCGMNMCAALTMDISRTLYPDGFGCIGDGCPSNDHANGDRDYTVGHSHREGGYALMNRSL